MLLIHAHLDEVESTVQWVNWIANAAPGAACVYYRGYLARYPSRVGIAVWEAHEAKLVELAQKKTGENEYLYFAVRKRNAKK